MNYHNEDYLQHYGVKGMKWGVRRKSQLPTSDIRNRYDSTKATYKQAKKDYNKAYNKAYNYTERHGMIGPFVSKKVKAERDRRWEDAVDKGKAFDSAKTQYKQAKKERKQAIKDTHKEINKKATLGDKLIYNDATRKKAAKYMVDNNMTMAEANKKAKGVANRNTAVFLGAYGAIAVASLYAANR